MFQGVVLGSSHWAERKPGGCHIDLVRGAFNSMWRFDGSSR